MMKNKLLKFLTEAAVIIALSLAIILPVRWFLVQPFYVMGASMEPNLLDREYLLIDEITFKFGELARGDMIVFRYPPDPRERFIKRVVGLPGEKIQIKNGAVYIYGSGEEEGVMLEEPYLPAGTRTNGPTAEPIALGDDEYYVLGDNRPYSKDSRAFGPVKKDSVIGRVFFRGWPPARITFFKFF